MFIELTFFILSSSFFCPILYKSLKASNFSSSGGEFYFL
jgi:hypothetical protein